MALFKCPHCGNQVSDKASKCPKCGADLTNLYVCPECGAHFPYDLESCPECGCPNEKYVKPVTLYKCPDCGSEYDIELTYCPECGCPNDEYEKYQKEKNKAKAKELKTKETKPEPAKEKTKEASKEKPKSSLGWLKWVLISAGVFAILYFALGGSVGNNEIQLDSSNYDEYLTISTSTKGDLKEANDWLRHEDDYVDWYNSITLNAYVSGASLNYDYHDVKVTLYAYYTYKTAQTYPNTKTYNGDETITVSCNIAGDGSASKTVKLTANSTDINRCGYNPNVTWAILSVEGTVTPIK